MGCGQSVASSSRMRSSRTKRNKQALNERSKKSSKEEVRNNYIPDQSPALERSSARADQQLSGYEDKLSEKLDEIYTCFGPMRLKKHVPSMLFVFPENDPQLKTLVAAAQQGGFPYNHSTNLDDALSEFLQTRQDIVFIDNRQTKYFQADTLCKSIRESRDGEFTTIVAVMKPHASNKDEPSILPILKAGFSRRFLESLSISSCLNEMQMLQYGEVNCRTKLHACQSLYTALDNLNEPVQISGSDSKIQYVNPAFERMTGFSSDEVLGKDIAIRSLPESWEVIQSSFKKGSSWDGACLVHKKVGDSVSHFFHLSPVLDTASNLLQCVSIRRCSLDHSHRLSTPLSNGDLVHSYHGRRKESIARIHSLTIEAPITQVMNIISSAQESSPLAVVEALNKVLDILRSSELYSPYFLSENLKEDQMTTNLVGGLVSQSLKRRFSENDVAVPKPAHHHHHPHHHAWHTHVPSMATTLTQVPENVQQILSTESQWDFNIIDLELHTNNHPLVYLGLTAFTKYSVCEFLDISENVLQNWLQMIEANYHSENSYHNATHAADVVHAISYFLCREQVKGMFDQMDEAALLISAAIHDVDHPGRNNAFMINSASELAILYNDLAVLENHHTSCAFHLTARDDSVNIFKNLSSEDYRTLRRMIVDTVLATEMSKHFEHVSKFITCINKGVLKMDEDTEVVLDECVMQQLSNPDNKIYIKRMLIKCADISNPTRPLELCKHWAARITDEYCKQTDEEKKKGYPVVMPVFDRNSCSVPKCQISFVDVFINDTFDALHYFLDVPDLIEHRESNYLYWKEREEEEALERLRQSAAISQPEDNQSDGCPSEPAPTDETTEQIDEK